MTDKQLLYKMARMLANPDELPQSAWGQQAGVLLQELQQMDPEQYTKLVATAIPKGHQANETPICWASLEDILTELTRRTSGYGIIYRTPDQPVQGCQMGWWGDLSTVLGMSRRFWLHMDTLVRRQIKEQLDNGEGEEQQET